jgi:hypothetical protein
MKKSMSELIVIIITLALAIIVTLTQNFNDTEYTITVTDKERVVTQKSSYYLVFGEDESENVLVFENADTLFRGKFDSSNIQGKLKIGGTYTVTVVGYRIPFLSMYQNIIEVEEIDNENPN